MSISYSKNFNKKEKWHPVKKLSFIVIELCAINYS